MKLYATITSERASKGQGGKTLRITLQGEDERVFSVLTAELALNNQVVVQYRDENQIGSYFTKFYPLIKGEKQKGEIDTFDCDKGKHPAIKSNGVCMSCGIRV